jgi:predicted esterase
MEKSVQSIFEKSYETAGLLNTQTRDIWWAFHGYGQLSQYFIKHFAPLAAAGHYIIAPQAPSKFYLHGQYERVGASWLTKVQVETEIRNNFTYLDAIWESEFGKEGLPAGASLHVLGFSQGVSMALRWAKHRAFPVHTLVLWAGMVPRELQPEDLAHLTHTRVLIIGGEKDVFFQEHKTQEMPRVLALLPQSTFLEFPGGHQMDSQFLVSLLHTSSPS